MWARHRGRRPRSIFSTGSTCFRNGQIGVGRLDGIETKRARTRERQRALQQEILKLEEIQRQVALYGTDLPDLSRASRHSFIAMQIGRVLPAEGYIQGVKKRKRKVYELKKRNLRSYDSSTDIG